MSRVDAPSLLVVKDDSDQVNLNLFTIYFDESRALDFSGSSRAWMLSRNKEKLTYSIVVTVTRPLYASNIHTISFTGSIYRSKPQELIAVNLLVKKDVQDFQYANYWGFFCLHLFAKLRLTFRWTDDGVKIINFWTGTV